MANVAQPNAGAVAAPPVREGEWIAGRYRVERVLGSGGMGVVVAAEHAELHQPVAIKFLLPAFARNPEANARFLREARAAVQIHSEHVGRVLDAGRLADGTPYLVMELLKGADLSQVLAREGPLPIPMAVDFVLQACEALAEAHAIGIVHRDLKPANLFRTYAPDGSACIKVVDFGISKMAEPDASGRALELTSTTAVMGSPHYMSPEQIRSTKNVDARSDIWSLGVILYELLTGRPAWDAESVSALAVMITTDAPARPRESRAEVPPGLEAIVLACLEKKPADRPQDVGALAERLAPFASPAGRASADRVVRVATRGTRGAIASEPAASGATWSHTMRPPRKGARALVALMVIAGASAAIVGVGAIVMTKTSAPRAAAPAAPSATIVIAQPSIAPPPSPPPPPVASETAAPSASASAANSAPAKPPLVKPAPPKPPTWRPPPRKDLGF